MNESTLVFIALGGIFAFSFYAVLISGQLSLGQAGFAGVAAYLSVVWAPQSENIFVVLGTAIIIGMVVGAITALILGIPTARMQGVFLAIATLGFAEAARIVLLNMEWTGGALGMPVPRLVTPAIAWCALAVVAFFFYRLRSSRFGRALEAIREDDLAASASGINVVSYRLMALTISGAVAGLFGVLWAYYMRLISPSDFGFSTAIDGLVSAVLGGIGLTLGPIFGGTFMEALPELQRFLGVEAGWIRPFLSSLALLLVILFLPGGLASLIPRRLLGKKERAQIKHAASTEVQSALTLARPEHGDETLIKLENVTKQYGGVKALQGVTLSIDAGEIIGLIGPNGAGKTTLVNLISGLIRPTTGNALTFGVDVSKSKVHKLAEAGLSRTFQHAKLFPELTVLQNVRVGAHLTSRQRSFLSHLFAMPSDRKAISDDFAQAFQCLDRVGLGDRASDLARNLSYGDQRRLEIARALASQPSLIILDEPAAGMNQIETDELSELIKGIAKDGISVLLIEHNVKMVMQTCDYIHVLNFGVPIAQGSPTEIASNPHVIEAYLGTGAKENKLLVTIDNEEEL